MTKLIRSALLAAGLFAIPLVPALATETEHLGFTVLPAPGPVVVDGAFSDWDLTAGTFACGDVENARDAYGVWVHAMWDERNLYLLARWQDLTPLSNPGSIIGDNGFNGDCLQIRVVTASDIAAHEVSSPDPQALREQNDTPTMRTSHLTCWRDRDGRDTINVAQGRRFNEGTFEGKERGATQAFHRHADGRGYDQELAIPWAMLAREGWKPGAGGRILITAEPNFTVAGGGRLTIKDLFRAGSSIDRVFTFTGPNCWSFATLEATGKKEPRPVRLSDAREFPVRLVDGLPTVDWTGLNRGHEPEGFKPIHFTLPEDGYVSLNLFRADGSVARQLLAAAAYTKGEHEVKWDGLGTTSVHVPGQPLEAGSYTWGGLWHPGIHLRLRGWAANSGKAPWGNAWGADHGNPEACASDGEQVYIGWGGGEGAKPLLACDQQGNIRWKNIRGGLAAANLVACDGTTVYAWNDIGQYATRGVYRVDKIKGGYTEWSSLKSTDLTMKDLWGDAPNAPGRPNALAAGAGKVFMSFSNNTVLAVDATTGVLAGKMTVEKPGDLEVAADGRLYVVSDARRVLRVDLASGTATEVAKAELGPKDWISSLAIGRDGEFYLGIRGERNEVQVRAADGKALRTIGRPGGRALAGPWQHDGMFAIAGLAIDGAGQLWVAEDDSTPRRVSVWDAASGAFKAEYFGSSTYGAIGGAINPKDPNLMIGQGCEWRLDPATGRSSCLGTITREGMGASRFGTGPGGRLYLAITSGFLADGAPVNIYERLGDGDYRLRTVISRESGGKQVRVWADANGDAREQPEEVKTWPNTLDGWLQGWYMPMTPDLSFCGSFKRLAVTGWTACGAPLYDLDQAKALPAPENGRFRGGMGAQHNHGSVDGRFVLWNGTYGDDHATLDCFDTLTGKQVWSYPSNFTGVHGSHRACSPEIGMIRGAYDIVGAAKLPDPIGNVWMVPTNKGEWHVLTERGYYLTKLFEGDPMKVAWPERAVPGADLDHCPPGAGEEAFGGSLVQDADGRISVQAGHVSFWNAEVTGLDRVQALTGGTLALSDEDVRSAAEWRLRAIRRAEGGRTLTIAKGTPVFSGNLDRDFAADARVTFAKQDDARVRTGLAYDGGMLYAGWEVRDDTPWVNGADAPEFMYARGDTVDLQLGTDPAAAKDRTEAVLGDWRLSIGPFQGKPTAVLYRKVASDKHPKSFHSGVIKDYPMESVIVLSEAKITVAVDGGKHRYVVEAAIPLAALGLTPKPGLALRGDFGATHGNAAGDDTVLRTYWCNQATGLVSDEVYELQMVPKEWGVLRFGE